MVRGGEGVLLTTSARAAQGAGVSSTQMDAAEAVRSLQAAQELGKVLGDAAVKQTALISADGAKAQQELLSRIDPKDKGKHDGAVNGQEASKAQSGARTLDADKPVEKFAEPLVLMDAPASINWATPASTVLFAGEQLHWTSLGDMHMTAAYTLSSVAANAAGYFSQNGGIQAIAANGPVSLQAHTDQLEILADKAVKVISVNDSIEIKANQKIVLQSGQSSITLDGGDITFACPGNFTVKGGQHVFEAGASAPATAPALPEGAPESDTIYLDHRYHDDQPLAGADYFVKLGDGTERTGKLDAQGRAVIPNVKPGVAQVSFSPMPGTFERVDKTPTPNYDAAPSESKIDSLIDKYLKTNSETTTPLLASDKEQA